MSGQRAQRIEPSILLLDIDILQVELGDAIGLVPTDFSFDIDVGIAIFDPRLDFLKLSLGEVSDLFPPLDSSEQVRGEVILTGDQTSGRGGEAPGQELA